MFIFSKEVSLRRFEYLLPVLQHPNFYGIFIELLARHIRVRAYLMNESCHSTLLLLAPVSVGAEKHLKIRLVRHNCSANFLDIPFSNCLTISSTKYTSHTLIYETRVNVI